MYLMSRLLLIASVLVYGYCAILLTVFCWMMNPVVGLAIMAVIAAIIAKSRKKLLYLTAHGTAYFAGEEKLRQAGMLDATKGLILGRMIGSAKVGMMAGIKALVDNRLKAIDACRTFLAMFRRKNHPAPLVRLPQAINTVCFGPPGAGKSTGLVIPFLLMPSCDESCVVLDFSGELALATAEARHRMGHEIIILDPYKVVTQ
jgi:type IV secretion system protein VirD4